MEEFDEPFDLSGILPELRHRMVAAAPMLLGRDARYDPEFFMSQVGLCSEGPLLRLLPKAYPFITEE